MRHQEIIILGIAGNCIDIAKSVEALATRGEQIKVLGFLDDSPAAGDKKIAGYPVLGEIADAKKFPGAGFVNGIGSTRSFKRKPDIIASAGLPPERWATVVHPTAYISPRATLGPGTAVLANVSVCTMAKVGSHVIILPNSIISHNAVIGDHSAIASGVCISGSAMIGANCYIGSNCSIREGLHIGDRTLVGMGAVVTRDTAPDSVVVGNPARPFKKM